MPGTSPGMTTFSTILVANRGEIACRVIRTARNMGFRAAAVYSEADADALHVHTADVAACIGPPETRASYLNIPSIVAAAQRMGAEAVHPGYGFLSENADFAQACADAGLTFIGPSPAAIAAMGNKATAKRFMEQAGVPCLPGYHGADQSDAVLAREADRIGYPLMVKAAAGGGGRGMRLVDKREDLAAALMGARAEAKGAFGSDELILEKAVVNGRHVEVQVLADMHGNIIHLGERDCSVQRRHQKVIEEAPSPAVNAELRSRMGASAVAVAKSIGYSNAGTVEFLLGEDGAFYFLEMNTRLQVEHAITELVTGLDFVEQQIRIARGEPLPLRQDEIRFSGHAIEARLYAEAPHKGFLPQPGHLALWKSPDGLGLRVDHGLKPSQDISAYYDPLLAKIIAHGADREEARRRLVLGLERAIALGTATNRAFLIGALDHPDFVAGRATTHFIPKHFARISPPTIVPSAFALAALLCFEASARRFGHDPARTWSSSGALAWPLALETGGATAYCAVSVLGSRRYRVEAKGHAVDIAVADEANGAVRVKADGRDLMADYSFAGDVLHLKCGACDFAVREMLYQRRTVAEITGAAERELRSPMNGKVVAVLVKEGDAVAKGQRLVIVEAMKMQHEMAASVSGTIARLSVGPGDQVATRQLLIEVEPAG